jgi:hypothetical protein
MNLYYYESPIGPPDPENANDDNIVSCLCTEIIDKFSSQDNRTILSDRFTILLYQFCVVLVQKCPAHIHDLSKKYTVIFCS